MQFKGDLIKHVLSLKGYPPETPIEDILRITNGIPLFVDMIPNYLNEESLDSQDKDININESKSPNDIVFEQIKKYLKKTINNFIVQKIRKFKFEYYNNFEDFQKNNFKKLLLGINNISEKLDLEIFGKLIDYQLMDYEYVSKDKTQVKIKSHYPEIIHLYKKELRIEFQKKEDLLANIHSCILNLTYNNRETAGMYFERIVQNHFVLTRIKNNKKTFRLSQIQK